MYLCPMSPVSKRALIYTRVSLDRDGEQTSTTRQEEACRGQAVARGWEVVGVESDNSISAYADKVRPGWENVLKMAAAGEIDVIIAYAVDRMTRSMYELERLIRHVTDHEVAVVTANGEMDLSTAHGKLIGRILAAVAAAEVEQKAARQRLANQDRANRGEPYLAGTRPFGYEDDFLTIREDEAKWIRKGASDLIAGKTLAEIHREWEAAGLRSAHSRENRSPWSRSGISALLQSPRYIGRRVYQGVDVGPAKWEPILDDTTHMAVRRILNDPSRKKHGGDWKSGGKASTLLTGLATCDVCGGGVRAGQFRIPAVPCYSCHNRHANTPREEADLWVAARVAAYFSDPNILDRILPTGDIELDFARERMEQAESALENAVDMLMAGEFTREQAARASGQAKATIAECEDIIKRATRKQSIAYLSIGTKAVADEWLDLSLGQKRQVLSEWSTKITLHSVGKGARHVPIDQRVTVDFFGQ